MIAIDRVMEIIKWLPNFLLLMVGIGAYSSAVSLGYGTASEGLMKVGLALVALLALVKLDRRLTQRQQEKGKTSFGPPDIAVQLVAVLAAAGLLTLMGIQVPLAFLLIMFTAAAILQVKRFQRPGSIDRGSVSTKARQKRTKTATKKKR